MKSNTLVFGLIAALSVLCATVLVGLGNTVPDFVAGLAIAAVSALAGVQATHRQAPR